MASRKTSPAAMAAHYGFRRMPFVGAGLDSYFRDACYEDTYRHLLDAIQQYQHLIVLFGEEGMGKTLLLRKLMHEAPDELKFLRCYSNSLNFEEILNFISDYLCLPGFEADQSQKIKILREHLDTSFSQGLHIILVIDDAHQMREHVLGNLLFLAQSDLKDNLSLQILLSGSNSLETLLASLQSTYSLDTNATRLHLEKLSNNDTVAFVHRQLETAGGLSKALFPSLVLERIAHHAGGIPQRINDLCHWALRIAYLNDQTQLSPEIIDKAAQELNENFPKNEQSFDPTGASEEGSNETKQDLIASPSNSEPSGQHISSQGQTPSHHTEETLKEDPNATKQPFVPSLSNLTASNEGNEDISSQDQTHHSKQVTLQPVPSLSPAPESSDDQTVAFTAISKKRSASTSPSTNPPNPEPAQKVALEGSSQDAQSQQPTLLLNASQDDDLSDMETRLQPVLKSFPEEERTVELKTLPENLLENYQQKSKQSSTEAFAANGIAQPHRRSFRRNDSPGLFVAIPLLILLASSIAFLIYQRDEFATFFSEITGDTSSSTPTHTESLPIPPLESDATSASSNGPENSPPEETTTPSSATSPAEPTEPAQQETESVPETTTPEETARNTTDLKSNGDMLLMLGDIASARLFYEAAVNAGDIPSLVAVGSTYDPVVLNRLGLRGFHADPVKAAEWYLRAREANATEEADKHLNGLRRWLNSGPSLAESKAEELKRLLDSVPSSSTKPDPAATADDDTSLNNKILLFITQIARTTYKINK